MNGRAHRPPPTPENPSRRATAHVSNPLPLPTLCRFCGGSCAVVGHEVVYNGRRFGDWPWAVMCLSCRAYVGLHPFTAIPLGTLANAEIRAWRKRAKLAFNPLWEGAAAPMTRDGAYAWLAASLGIPAAECHIGWFDEPMCAEVALVCRHRGAASSGRTRP